MRYVAASAVTDAHTHTDTQNDYCNPTVYVPSVKNICGLCRTLWIRFERVYRRYWCMLYQVYTQTVHTNSMCLHVYTHTHTHTHTHTYIGPQWWIQDSIKGLHIYLADVCEMRMKILPVMPSFR